MSCLRRTFREPFPYERSQDDPVEMKETIAAADRHEFRYEVAMDRDDRSL